jgi:hypothetical protein
MEKITDLQQAKEKILAMVKENACEYGSFLNYIETKICWKAFCQLMNRHQAILTKKENNKTIYSYSGKFRTDEDYEAEQLAKKTKTPKKEETTTETKTKEQKMTTTNNNMNFDMNNMMGNFMNMMMSQMFGNFQQEFEKMINSKLEEVKEEIKKEIPEVKTENKTIIVNDSVVIGETEEILPYWFGDMAQALHDNNNVMLSGDAGTGKGFQARIYAKMNDMEFFQVNAIQDKYELTGFIDANGKFVKTTFYNACYAAAVENKKVLFMFDEFDCSLKEVIKIFNEFLNTKEFEFPNGEKLDCSKNMLIVAGCNTLGTGASQKYIGEKLDKSTLDRFSIIMTGYDTTLELAMTGNNTELVEFYDEFRKIVVKYDIDFEVTYRSLQKLATSGFTDLTKNLKINFIKYLPSDDLENILHNFTKTDNKYYKACKELLKVA